MEHRASSPAGARPPGTFGLAAFLVEPGWSPSSCSLQGPGEHTLPRSCHIPGGGMDPGGPLAPMPGSFLLFSQAFSWTLMKSLERIKENGAARRGGGWQRLGQPLHDWGAAGDMPVFTCPERSPAQPGARAQLLPLTFQGLWGNGNRLCIDSGALSWLQPGNKEGRERQERSSLQVQSLTCRWSTSTDRGTPGEAGRQTDGEESSCSWLLPSSPAARVLRSPLFLALCSNPFLPLLSLLLGVGCKAAAAIWVQSRGASSPSVGDHTGSFPEPGPRRDLGAGHVGPVLLFQLGLGGCFSTEIASGNYRPLPSWGQGRGRELPMRECCSRCP